MTEGTPNPAGTYPKRMFRVLDEEVHARAFVEKGQFRFRMLQEYQTIEDKARADRSEGTGDIRIKSRLQNLFVGVPDGAISRVKEVSGLMHKTFESGNTIYICCFSSPKSLDPEDTPTKFGNFIVQINEPHSLALDVVRFLWRQDPRFANNISCEPVIYNKGEVGSEDGDWTYAFRQKPREHEAECEYRLVLLARNDPVRRVWPDTFDVNLQHPLPYASVVLRSGA